MIKSLQPVSFLALMALTLAPAVSNAASSCTGALHDILSEIPDESQLTRFHEFKIAVSEPTAATLRQLKMPVDRGGLKSVRYLVDVNDRVYLASTEASIDLVGLSKDEIPLATLVDETGNEVVMPLKEVGELRFQPSDISSRWKKVLFGNKKNSDKFVFEKQAGFDLSDDESAKIFNQVAKDGEGSEDEMARVAARGKDFDQARVLHCTEIFQSQTRTDKFIFDKLAADMTIMTTNIAIMNPHRFDGALVYWGLQEPEPGRNYDEDLLAADFMATPVNTIFKTTVGLALVQRGAGLSKSFATRTGVSLAGVGVQALIYGAMTDNDSKGIGAFNTGYTLYSAVKSHYLDQWVFNSLPDLAYHACLQNSALRFLVSPTTIRFGEGFASSVIYYKARKKFVGE